MGRSPGAPWLCPAPGSSCGQDVLGWIHRVRAEIPTSSCPCWKFQGGGDTSLFPVVLCQALPQGRLDLSSAWVASPTGKLSLGQALNSPALIFLHPLYMAPVRVGAAPQSPRAKGDVCLVPGRCYRTMSNLGPPASPSLMGCETKISVWVPKLSS